jgi:hypothetical protein
MPIWSPYRSGGDWQRWAYDPAVPLQARAALACGAWHGIGKLHPIANGQGRLLPEWRALLLRYPKRFMVGSDPVWPVEQLDSWGTSDTGWQELGRFRVFHRGWLAQLPPDVARRIGCMNAVSLFGMQERRVSCAVPASGS